jgi:hypothetical protein
MVRFLSDRRSKAFWLGARGAHYLIQRAASRALYFDADKIRFRQ